MRERAVFAVDVGATRTKYGVVTGAGVESYGVNETPKASAVEHAARVAGLHRAHAPALPLAVSWAESPNTGCAVTEIQEELVRAGVRAPLVVGDMVAAALGEAAGAGEPIMLMQIGSGVGGAFADGGRAQPVITGHVVFRPDGIPCNSGMRGTVDAYLGWHAMRRRLAALDPPLQLDWPGEIVTAAETHPGARVVLQDALAAAGFAASMLVCCSDADALILAGGVTAAWGELLVDAVRAGIDARVWPGRAREVRVVVSDQRERAPLIGLHRAAA